MGAILHCYHHQAGKLLPWLAAALLLIAIVLPHGSQPVAALLLLLTLPLLLIKLPSGIAVARIWIVMLVLPIVVAIPLFVKSGTGEALAAPARYIVVLLTLFGLSRIPLDAKLILRAASGAGLLTILSEAERIFTLNVTGRMPFGIGWNDSGYVGAMLLALALAQYHYDRGKPLWRLFALSGIGCLIVTVLITGTRGGWAAMILVLLVQFMMLQISRPRKLLLTLAGLSLFAVALFTVPALKQRGDLIKTDLITYTTTKSWNTSIGMRLDLWQIALDSFVDSPLWGVSYQRHSELMDRFTAIHQASKPIGNDGRSSSHNEIWNALSRKGLIGVLAILLLYLVPMRYFIGQLRRRQGALESHIALAGFGVVMAILVCGMIEAPLMNVRVGTTYGFIMILLYHLLSITPVHNKRDHKRDHKSADPSGGK